MLQGASGAHLDNIAAVFVTLVVLETLQPEGSTITTVELDGTSSDRHNHSP
jgi:hypothetical protein